MELKRPISLFHFNLNNFEVKNEQIRSTNLMFICWCAHPDRYTQYQGSILQMSKHSFKNWSESKNTQAYIFLFFFGPTRFLQIVQQMRPGDNRLHQNILLQHQGRNVYFFPFQCIASKRIIRSNFRTKNGIFMLGSIFFIQSVFDFLTNQLDGNFLYPLKDIVIRSSNI